MLSADDSELIKEVLNAENDLIQQSIESGDMSFHQDFLDNFAEMLLEKAHNYDFECKKLSIFIFENVILQIFMTSSCYG